MICYWTHSLDKVFPGKERTAESRRSASVLQGEVFSLQLAYRPEYLLNPLAVEVLSPLAPYVQVRQVYSMPATFFGEKLDSDVLDSRPGLYPDLLSAPERYRSAPDCWHSLWVTVRIPAEQPPGRFPLRLKLRHVNLYRSERNFEQTTPEFTLEVLPMRLPEAELTVTEWLHCDCLAAYYGLEIWSEAFFRVLKNYLLNMRRHHINMVYVPLFTPPLDTQIGMERPTTQSVEVVEEAPGRWRFGFERTERFIELALECGMEYLEFSHLFTQWGAEFTPKIMVRTGDGSEVRRFGWDVRSDSELYRKFLEALLPELNKMLQKHGWQKRAYFHISDEPYEKNLAAYRKASELFHRNLSGVRFMDALSRPEYFTAGLVEIPVPPADHIEEFRDLAVPERWCYYCVSQWDKVPNQFAHLPSMRNRIFGVLAYIYDLDGFLHWGYNFWFGQLSTFAVDPYRDICAGGGFPPGDAFKVYPGPDGMPEDSIRHEVFLEAMQDLAALQKLERFRGRRDVLAWIAAAWGGILPDMRHYPRNAEWLLEFRENLNRLLARPEARGV